MRTGSASMQSSLAGTDSRVTSPGARSMLMAIMMMMVMMVMMMLMMVSK